MQRWGIVLMSTLSACLGPVGESWDAGPAFDAGPEEDAGANDRVCFPPEGRTFVWVRGCTRVAGDLSANMLVELDGLGVASSLVAVDGRLLLDTLPLVRTLDGLDRLRTVGALWMVNLSAVEDLSPLAKLTNVSDSLYLNHLPRLASLRGLSALRRVPGDLAISDLELVETLEGLDGVAEVGSLTLAKLPRLRSLRELRSLKLVTGKLVITIAPQLPQSEIAAFRARVRILGQVSLSGTGD